MEATKEDLEIRIANEKLAKPKLTAEFVTMWLERFRKLDMRKKEHRQQLIDTFVNSVYLFDDKLTLHINYKDGTKTVTFDEMKAALDEQAVGSDLGCRGAPKARFLSRNRAQTVKERAVFRERGRPVFA